MVETPAVSNAMPVSVTRTALNVWPALPVVPVGRRSESDAGMNGPAGSAARSRALMAEQFCTVPPRRNATTFRRGAAGEVRAESPSGRPSAPRRSLAFGYCACVRRALSSGVRRSWRPARIEHRHVRAGVRHALGLGRRRPLRAQLGERVAEHDLRVERRERLGARGDERLQRVGAARDRRVRRPRQARLDARGRAAGGRSRCRRCSVSESLSVTSTRWISGAASPAASEAIAAGSPARSSGLTSLSAISE